MKKIKLSKKMKFIIGLSGVALVGVTLPVALLTSCSSAANPYGPYTIIENSTDSSSIGKAGDNVNSLAPQIKYDTKRQEYFVWNDEGQWIDKDYQNGKFNNKWISSNDVLNYYNYLSNQQVKAALPWGDDSSKVESRKSFLEKYYYVGENNTSDSNELLKNASENYNFENLNFVYGVKPTEEMQKIVNLYNQMTIQGNIFKLSSALATELISYGVTSEFGGMYNWLANGQPEGSNNPLSIKNTSNTRSVSSLYSTSLKSDEELKKEAQDFANSTITQWGQQIKGNSSAIELTLGVGTAIGQGANTYHLWPSGFSAKYEIVNENSSVNGDVNALQDTTLAKGTPGINNPYPINPGEKGPTQYKLKVTDIQINYQWYKTKKTGGEYVTYKEVNDHLNNEQKDAFAKTSNKDGLVHNSAYKLPISALEFNVTPMTSSYIDPIQSSLIDYVYNGVYSIQPRLINTNNDIKWEINTPKELLSKVPSTTNGGSTLVDNDKFSTGVSNVPWQSFRNISKNKFNKQELIDKKVILESTANAISSSINGQDNNLTNVPYYQANSQSWTANSDYESSFQILSDVQTKPSTQQNSALLNYYQTKDIIGLFSNVYGTAGLKPEDRPVANNHNRLNKDILLKMWKLGWMAKNVNNTNDAQSYVTDTKYLNDGKTNKVNQLNPEWTKEYKQVYDIVKSNDSLEEILKSDPKAKTTDSIASIAKKGIESFYKVVNPSNISAGQIYELNEAGSQYEVKTENMPTNSATSPNKPANQSIVANYNRRK